MPNLPIFTENEEGELVQMKPSAPQNEASLQELIARFPETIAGESGSLLLIRREQAVPDAIDGGGRWSLDHLFVSRDAVPVLVEVKRASDTRIRREVVGQVLDYAANGVAYWKPGALQEAFRHQCEEDGVDPTEQLDEFLDSIEPDTFWEQVDANLSAGRIRMIIAADEIPRELARIVEFLNEQMSATFLAVELKYYEADDGRRTLAPRMIGLTERSESSKASRKGNLEPISVGAWVEKYLAPRGHDIAEAANSLIEYTQSRGAHLEPVPSQDWVNFHWVGDDGKRVTLLFLSKTGRAQINFRGMTNRVGLAKEDLRIEHLKAFGTAVGGLSTENTKGYPGFSVGVLQDSNKRGAFLKALDAFKSDAIEA